MASRTTILLVDDSDVFRTQLKEMLRERGFHIVEASNGRKAIEAAASECPDPIVMDLSMPIMDGLTALRRIRRAGGQCQTIPILAISASGPELKEVTLRAGCNDYFSKYKIHRLITAVEHFLRKQ